MNDCSRYSSMMREEQTTTTTIKKKRKKNQHFSYWVSQVQLHGDIIRAHASNEEQLELYGYYKYISNVNTVPPPPSSSSSKLFVFNVKNHMKLEAWRKVFEQQLVVEKAMEEYCNLAEGLLKKVFQKNNDLYNNGFSDHDDDDVSSDDDDMNVCDGGVFEESSLLTMTTSAEESNVSSNRDIIQKDDDHNRSFSLRKWVNSFRVVPLGTLDITYSDLFYALYACLVSCCSVFWIFSSRARIRHKYEILIEKQWNRKYENCCSAKGDDGTNVTHNCLVTSSVRSAFDLYLQLQRFEPGSEIIMSAVQIHGMIQIAAEMHGLNIIPVDIDFGTLGPTHEDIVKAVSDKTVAVLVAHIFGSVCSLDFDKLSNFLKPRGIQLLEDCAETFISMSSDKFYCGYSNSDAIFYSFGTIKTGTSLGGGIMLLKNNDLYQKAKTVQSSYEEMTTMSFFVKVLKAFIIQLVSQSTLIFGTLVYISSIFNIDLDELITSAVRGYNIQAGGTEGAYVGSTTVVFIKKLRKRISLSNLILLERRLRKYPPTRVNERIRQCLEANKLLSSIEGITLPGAKSFNHFYWLFPINVENRDSFSKFMMKEGYEVPKGTTQLNCITNYNAVDPMHKCQKAEKMMSSVLYLPVTSNVFNSSKLQSLVATIQNGHNSSRKPISSLDGKSKTLFKGNQWQLVIYLCFATYMLHEIIRYYYHILFLVVPVCLLSVFHTFHFVIVGRDIYCDKSNLFIKYQGIHKRVDFNSYTRETLTRNANEVPDVVSSCSSEWEDCGGRMVFLTGCTGFIGSILLRDLLLNRERLEIDGVIVLCRKKGKYSAAERISLLLEETMFSFLNSDEKKSLIRVVEGDVSSKGLGMSLENQNFCMRSVSHIVHSAASVSFNQSLRGAAISNITPALQLQRFSKEWDATFVYLSTSFVHGKNEHNIGTPLPEELFSIRNYDAREVYESMLGTESLASSAMVELEFPNTYTFSKSICEHLLLSNSNSKNNRSKTIIVRPAVVGPALVNPYEGWAGQKPSTLVAGACLYFKNPRTVWSFGATQIPVIPVDVVSKAIIDITFASLPFDENKNRLKSKCIYNLAWSAAVPKAGDIMHWDDFGYAAINLGSARGYHPRWMSQLFYWLVVRRTWGKQLSFKSFKKLHSFLTVKSFQIYLFYLKCFDKKSFSKILKMEQFIDLPLLFFPFNQTNFFFESELSPPDSFDGQRYIMSCLLAADEFLRTAESRRSPNSSSSNGYCTGKLEAFHPQSTIIGGKEDPSNENDCLWALTQPKGNLAIRIIGIIMKKILRNVCSRVTVNVDSFADLSDLDDKTHIVLVPTHRSLLDFMLISYIFFSMPEMRIDLPHICAADSFQSLPILGWFAWCAGAFFIRRGRGRADPDLLKEIQMIKSKGKATFEVFIEGGRSRDRRFCKPKTGVLRCLNKTSGAHVIKPISISYEKIPEQNAFADHIESGKAPNLSLIDLMKWLVDLFRGRIDIGTIHIAGAESIKLDKKFIDFSLLTQQIQIAQQDQVHCSNYHINATSVALNVPRACVLDAVRSAGKFWETSSPDYFPSSRTESWFGFFQLCHIFTPFLFKTHPAWAKWMNPLENGGSNIDASDEVALIHKALVSILDTVDTTVDSALDDLKTSGYKTPSANHVLEYVCIGSLPIVLVKAAIEMRVPDIPPQQIEISPNKNLECQEVEPIFESDDDNSVERFGFWGYRDSMFVLHVEKDGSQAVVLRGDRYRISGKPLFKVIPFFENEMNIKVDPKKIAFPMVPFVPSLPSCRIGTEGLKLLSAIIDNDSISLEAMARRKHGSGHSQEDMYAIRSGIYHKSRRFPDCVVWPSSELEVKQLIDLSVSQNWCLIPYGGGTNVSHSTWCPSLKEEPRPIVSVDMKKMNKLMWVNEEDGLIHVGAGATGKELAELLSSRGLSCGHEPDSYEFSTVGGWIATYASGMKRSRYGNIEDIVLEVQCISSSGVLSQNHHNHNRNKTAFGRTSCGLKLTSLLFGSEGCLGIIVSATLKVWKIPDCREFESAIFPSFSCGIDFVRSVSLMGNFKPASLRLVDNEQFRLGQALNQNDDSIFLKLSKKSRIAFEGIRRNLNPQKVAAASITFEGTRAEVQFQKSQIRKLCKKHGGFMMGANTGRSGYDLTFAIAYLRDFAMTYYCLGESFESFVPWSVQTKLIEATKKRVLDEYRARYLPGKPLISCRITQLYDEGACVYFYFCMYFRGVSNPSLVYSEIEQAARDEILKQGGSLSHHHGIGKCRAQWMNCRGDSKEEVAVINSKALSISFQALKASVDPHNIFGARNGSFAP